MPNLNKIRGQKKSSSSISGPNRPGKVNNLGRGNGNYGLSSHNSDPRMPYHQQSVVPSRGTVISRDVSRFGRPLHKLRGHHFRDLFSSIFEEFFDPFFSSLGQFQGAIKKQCFFDFCQFMSNFVPFLSTYSDNF